MGAAYLSFVAGFARRSVEPVRTGHLGLPSCPLLSGRTLAHGVSAVLGHLGPGPAGPAPKMGTPPDAVATPDALS